MVDLSALCVDEQLAKVGANGAVMVGRRWGNWEVNWICELSR